MPKQTKRIRVSREACSNEAADSAKLMRMGFSKEAALTALASNGGCGFDAALAFLARQAAREETFKKNRVARETNLCSLHALASPPLRSKVSLANSSKTGAATMRSRLGKENNINSSSGSSRISDKSRSSGVVPQLVHFLESTNRRDDSSECKGAVPRNRRSSVASTSTASRNNHKNSQTVQYPLRTVVDAMSEVCEVCRKSTAVESDSDSDESTDAQPPAVVLLCEGCDAEAHLSCLGLRRVPKKDWYCSACVHKSNSSANNTSTVPHQDGHQTSGSAARRQDTSSSISASARNSGKVSPGKSYAAAAASPPAAAKAEAKNRRCQGGADAAFSQKGESARIMPPPPPPLLGLQRNPLVGGGDGALNGPRGASGRNREGKGGVARPHGRPTRAQLMQPTATPAPKPPPLEAPEDGLLTEDRDCSDSETKATLPRTRVAVENLVGVFAVVAHQKPTPQKQVKRTRRGI